MPENWSWTSTAGLRSPRTEVNTSSFHPRFTKGQERRRDGAASLPETNSPASCHPHSQNPRRAGASRCQPCLHILAGQHEHTVWDTWATRNARAIFTQESFFCHVRGIPSGVRRLTAPIPAAFTATTARSLHPHALAKVTR